MVTADFLATVAPLGTALPKTDSRCFGRWRTSRRSARRRCCRLARRLPRRRSGHAAAETRQEPEIRDAAAGPDPDDLVRSGGREAMTEVIAAARPLGAMLWARETEGQRFDTPERRAALEARVNEVTAVDRRRVRAQILPAGVQRRGCRSSSPPRKARRQRRAQLARQLGRSGEAGWRRAASGDWRASQRLNRPRPPPMAGPRLTWWSASNSRSARVHRGYRGMLSPARGAHPASRPRPPLAAARPPGGTRPARVPPCRRPSG